MGISNVCVYVFAALLCVASCQQDCPTIDAGLRPLLDPCVESVETCVISTENRDLDTFNGIFCISAAQTQYESFLRCTNQSFTDQLFGSICGGPDCATGDGPFTDCAPAQGSRCYNIALRNDATAAFESCLCSNDGQSSSQPDCSAECAEDLQQLVDDVGCCVNGVIYAYLFNTCGDQDTDIPHLILNNLFDSCSVTLPDACLNPFGTDGTGTAGTGTVGTGTASTGTAGNCIGTAGSKMLTSDLVSIAVSLEMLLMIIDF